MPMPTEGAEREAVAGGWAGEKAVVPGGRGRLGLGGTAAAVVLRRGAVGGGVRRTPVGGVCVPMRTPDEEAVPAGEGPAAVGAAVGATGRGWGVGTGGRGRKRPIDCSFTCSGAGVLTARCMPPPGSVVWERGFTCGRAPPEESGAKGCGRLVGDDVPRTTPGVLARAPPRCQLTPPRPGGGTPRPRPGASPRAAAFGGDGPDPRATEPTGGEVVRLAPAKPPRGGEGRGAMVSERLVAA
mmetsp:Transcript_40911/g.103061  ORF Transcript_40911/g.103061 Transcript_40911/m.103061 type:complete len:240 (-) Transcript_40911:202-921(-)